MRGTPNHRPPGFMQPTPEDNRTPDVLGQVWTWRADGRLINHEIAREIAAWWQSPDAHGIAFAMFQSTGTIDDALGNDIEREIRLSDNKEDQQHLYALLAYVEEVTVTAWVVNSNTIGYLPESEPHAFTLDYADARTAFIGYLKEAPDTLTNPGYEDCTCSPDGAETCDRCDLEATVGAYLADDLPAAGPASLWLRPDHLPLPINHWLDSRELTYAEFRREVAFNG